MQPTPPKKREMIPISVRLDKQQIAALDSMAHKSGLTRSSLIKVAITRFIQKGL